MAVGKEILTKIRSVQNTQKITKAMQMVSTSKMRKTQERMRLARPYADRVSIVMSHLAQTQEDHGIQLLESRQEIRRAGIILITTDKGLCGGLNANVLKKFFAQVQEYHEQGVAVEVVCLGSKGLAACQRVGLNVIASVTNLGDTPKTDEGKVDFSKDFFGKACNLTVSGQLEGEIFAMAFRDIYTFGPTFRSAAADWQRCFERTCSRQI